MEHEHDYTFAVNGTEYTRESDVVTYEEVVHIAFPTPNPSLGYTVTFENAESEPHDGTLDKGKHVRVKHHGTTFDVTETIGS